MSPSLAKEIVLVMPGPHRLQVGAIVGFPLAILSLAGWLRQDKRWEDKMSLLDMRVDRIKSEDFKNAKIVGITAITGEQIYYGLQAAKMAREANPDALILWGGIHASLLPDETIQNEYVDMICKGEGEETFREIVEAVFDGKPLANIPGSLYKKENGVTVLGPKREFVDLDTLPLPAYDMMDMTKYHGIEKEFNYQSSRGCPFRCDFCYNIEFAGRSWRKKSADKVVKDLVYLHKKYNVEEFIMEDDEFLIDMRRAEKIFEGIIAEGVKFGVTFSCRLDMARKVPVRIWKKIREAGTVNVYFGAESGSDKMLKDMHKDITTEDILEGALRVANTGIRPVLSFMSGFPTEDFDQFKETLGIIQKLWDLHPGIVVNGIFPFNPYPGAPLYHQAVEYGFEAPTSLEQWGKWSFQYKPNNPWIETKKRNWMRTAFHIVRFRYYFTRYERRYAGQKWRHVLFKLFFLPLWWSANFRWKKKWFDFPFEWNVFATVVQKTFGYI